MTAPDGPVTRALREEDASRWRELHRGYTDFYAVATTDEQRERLWRWLLTHEHGLEGLVVEDEGRVVGVAHVRPVVRPLHVTVDGYLDDLYVAPEARGSGAASVLLHAVRRLGATRGWSLVRWMTDASNTRAQAFYDREGATALSVVTYDVDVEPAPPG